MGDGVRERIARNNYTFREANEKIRAKADEYDAPVDRIPFLCECPLPDCTEILRLTLAEYADIRAHPAHFFIIPAHEQAESAVGHIVSREGSYLVVEKDEDVGER